MSTITKNNIYFNGINGLNVQSIYNNSQIVCNESKALFQEINRGAAVYLNSRNKITINEDLNSLDLKDTNKALGDVDVIADAKVGELIKLDGKTDKQQHIARIFNGLDLIIKNCERVCTNISSGLYRDLENSSQIAIAHIANNFDELKKQITDTLRNISIFDNLRETAIRIAGRWNIEGL